MTGCAKTLQLVPPPILPAECKSSDGWVMTEIHYPLNGNDLSKVQIYCASSGEWKKASELVGQNTIPENATHLTVLAPTLFRTYKLGENFVPVHPLHTLEQKFFFSALSSIKELQLISAAPRVQKQS